MHQAKPVDDSSVLIYNIDPGVSKTERMLTDGWEYIDNVNPEARYYRGIRTDATFRETTLQAMCFGPYRQPAPELEGRLISIKRTTQDAPMNLFAETNNGIQVNVDFVT